MALSNDEIFHMAKLARLRLEEADLSRCADRLNSVLDYVAKLGELDTDDVPELAHGDGLSNVFREDLAEPCDADARRRIIAAFPRREGDLLEVQAVFGSKRG
jgi:aspartyl-tRNA(Asn)/glutamyl-tRNA(Gln) amidotransferase subunit C